MLVQIYRWFLRYISISGFLSIRTYRSKAIGIALSVMLTLFWYATTNLTWIDPNWPARIDSLWFVAYLFTCLVTWSVGTIGFTVMQFLGQLTAARYRSFDVGLYIGFAICGLIVAGAIGLAVAGKGASPVIRLSLTSLR